MSFHAADALMEIFGFKRVANDEKPLDNQPSLDDDSGSLNEGMEMSEVKNEGLEVVRMQHMAVADHNGDLRWMTARFVADCELYAMPDFGRAPDLCRHSEALAGYAVRDAQIAAIKFELEVARTDELSAAVWAATETIKHELWDAQAELAEAKETISRYEVTADNCDVLRAELANQLEVKAFWIGRTRALEVELAASVSEAKTRAKAFTTYENK